MAKTLFTTNRIKLIREKEFITIAFNLGNEIFIVHVVFFISFVLNLEIHSF